jgi:hypothetical protein
VKKALSDKHREGLSSVDDDLRRFGGLLPVLSGFYQFAVLLGDDVDALVEQTDRAVDALEGEFRILSGAKIKDPPRRPSCRGLSLRGRGYFLSASSRAFFTALQAASFF